MKKARKPRTFSVLVDEKDFARFKDALDYYIALTTRCDFVFDSWKSMDVPAQLVSANFHALAEREREYFKAMKAMTDKIHEQIITNERYWK